MKQTICSVGDAILLEKLPREYSNKEIKDIVSSADVRLFNLENVVSDEPVHGSTYCGGTWLMSREDALDDTLSFGFNGCSFANNHTMDYSYDGMFATLKAVKKRNIPICGAGKDLKEASDYVLVGEGDNKAALISICSTFNDAARAGNSSDTVPGRPGLNPLRFSTTYYITPEHMQALREISAGTHIDGRRNRSRAGGYTPYPPEGCFGFGDYTFRESETEGKFTKVNPIDMERTVKTIKEALKVCENVIVNIHSHEIKNDTDDEPDDFLVEFARSCIDAGAATIIGTGTHQLKAVEIYKGRPIFYSLGNFIFQSDMPFCMPDDFREKYKLPYGLSAKEQIQARSKKGNGGLHADVNNFRSLMPYLTYENGKITDITLYTLRLDMHTGFPALADKAEAKIICDYLKDRNRPYGTKMELQGNVIKIMTEVNTID